MDHDCVSPTLSSFAVMNSEAAQSSGVECAIAGDGYNNVRRPFHNDECNKMNLLQRPTARRRGAYDSSALALSAMAAAMEGFDDDDHDHHDGCDETGGGGGGGGNRTLSRTRPKRPRVAFPEEQEEDDDDDKDDELSPGDWDGSGGGGCVVQSVIELENAGGTMSFRAQRRRTNSWNASFGRRRRSSSCASGGGNDVLPLMMSPPHGMPL